MASLSSSNTFNNLLHLSKAANIRCVLPTLGVGYDRVSHTKSEGLDKNGGGSLFKKLINGGGGQKLEKQVFALFKEISPIILPVHCNDFF